MGSSGSKAAQKATRQYPVRAPGTAIPPRPPPPAGRASAGAQTARPRASFTKDEAIRADATDPGQHDFSPPGFAERLRQMGIADPNPTYSPSSTAGSTYPDAAASHASGPVYPSAGRNTTLTALDARRRLQEQADREFDNRGKSADQGREFLDVSTIRNALLLRQKGATSAEIEARLKLKKGLWTGLDRRAWWRRQLTFLLDVWPPTRDYEVS